MLVITKEYLYLHITNSQTQKINAMKTISKVTLEKVKKNYTMGFNCISTVSEFTRVVYFNDGSKISASALLSEIGNKGFDSWSNVEKIKRSTSNNNIQKYLSKFINNLETHLK